MFDPLRLFLTAVTWDLGRAKADDLVISLFLVFVLFGDLYNSMWSTVAVLLLSFVPSTGDDRRLGGRLQQSAGLIKDTAFFLDLFVLFIQIWITTSVPMGDFFHLDPGFFLRHFLRSIANLFGITTQLSLSVH